MKEKMRKLSNRFFIGFANGIMIIMPVIITVFIVRFLVFKVNDLVLNPLFRLMGIDSTKVHHVYIIKGAIFVMVVVGVAMIGWGAKILVVNRIFSWGENIIIKVPIMGKIYNAVKQISRAFIGQGKTIFKQVVLIEYPRKGIYSIGFTTGTSRGEIQDKTAQDCVNVFLPTTPNPTSGVFLMVPKEEIHFLKMSVEDGMKLIISGGSVTPSYFQEEGRPQ